jgi:hypothetical protein
MSSNSAHNLITKIVVGTVTAKDFQDVTADFDGMQDIIASYRKVLEDFGYDVRMFNNQCRIKNSGTAYYLKRDGAGSSKYFLTLQT